MQSALDPPADTSFRDFAYTYTAEDPNRSNTRVQSRPAEFDIVPNSITPCCEDTRVTNLRKLSMRLAQRMQKPSETMQELHWSSIDIASLAIEGGLQYIGQQERIIMKWQEENHRLREEVDRLREEEVKRLRERMTHLGEEQKSLEHIIQRLEFGHRAVRNQRMTTSQ